MFSLKAIADAIEANRIKITDHADEEAQLDLLNMNDILDSIKNGEIIDEYENDKPYPSSLILSHIKKGMPIHTVWAYNVKTKYAVLITIYKPDLQKWFNDMKTRR